MPARVDPQLPKLFHSAAAYGHAVRAMTPRGGEQHAANYQIGSLALDQRLLTIQRARYASEAKWRVETLFLHEAVPGHHMQVARRGDRGLHPCVRRRTSTSLLGGWALYAEWLGLRPRVLPGSVQRYGNLQAQLFRAARLVVDTVIHAQTGRATRRSPTCAARAGRQGLRCERGGPILLDRRKRSAICSGTGKMRDLRARAEKSLGAGFNAGTSTRWSLTTARCRRRAREDRRLNGSAEGEKSREMARERCPAE